MHTDTRASRTRTILGATSLVLGSVLFAATDLVNPYTGSLDNHVAVARDEVNAVAAYSLIWLAASFLLVAGAATAMGRIRNRGAGLALAGGTLAGAGAIAGAAIAGFESIPITLASALPEDELLKATLTSFDSSAVLGVLFLILLLGTALGWPLLIGGAARAGLMSRWFVALSIVGVVAIIASQASTSVLVDLVASALLVIPIFALARAVVRPDPVAAMAQSSIGPEEANSVTSKPRVNTSERVPLRAGLARPTTSSQDQQNRCESGLLAQRTQEWS